jgi:glucokinase
MSGRTAIAIDLGGTAIKHGIVDDAGAVLDRGSASTPVSLRFDDVASRVAEIIRERAAECERRGAAPVGVGVGIPGGVYPDRAVVSQSPNFPEWRDVPFRAALAAATGLPVFLENDANLAALGEQWMGAGRGVDSLLAITLGTGVGGGLILGGEIWSGADGMAGEIGHVTVLGERPAWLKGGRSTLEALTNARAIVERGQAAAASGTSPALTRRVAAGEEITAKTVFLAAEEGDEGAREVFRVTGRYLGIAISGVVNLLNLPLVVVGGGVSPAMKYMEPVVREEIDDRCFRIPAARVKVRRAELGNAAGLLGAARITFQLATKA